MFGKTQPAGILEIFTNKEATKTIISDLSKTKNTEKFVELLFAEPSLKKRRSADGKTLGSNTIFKDLNLDLIENRKRAYIFTLRDMVAFFVDERKHIILKVLYKKGALKQEDLNEKAIKNEEILNQLIPSALKRLTEAERKEALSELFRIHPQPHQNDMVQMKDEFEKRYKLDGAKHIAKRGIFAKWLNENAVADSKEFKKNKDTVYVTTNTYLQKEDCLESVRQGIGMAILDKELFFNNLFFEEKVVIGFVDKLEETLGNIIQDEAKQITEENFRTASQSLASKLGANEY